ncbi:MAG: 30S ribosome-binding factor RbfA [Clostridiales bacterium]|jgi:ribosome-binding factor A|nr:30S ribosome-binding factor RbfA [Clostridiales bacterium]
MASNRIERINEDIQRVLSGLLRNVKDPRLNKGMLSITAVQTTGDLRYAQVYVSALAVSDEKELLKGLKSASGYLRRELGSILKLRYTPELQFHLDKSIEHGAHISKILNTLDIPGEEGQDG